jgi:hypothetical protein
MPVILAGLHVTFTYVSRATCLQRYTRTKRPISYPRATSKLTTLLHLSDTAKRKEEREEKKKKRLLSNSP